MTTTEAAATKRISQVLLENDYESLREFALQCPLKFQRMYGYVIGLKLDNLSNSAQQNKFLFMRYLLKNVKSRIFKVYYFFLIFFVRLENKKKHKQFR